MKLTNSQGYFTNIVKMTGWIFLSLAIAMEVTGTFFLKLPDGFAKWHWGLVSIFFYSCCFWVLAPAMKVIPVGVVYAIWAGVGILAATLLGIFVFSEKLGIIQYMFIVLILIGAVGLRLTTEA